MIAMMDGQMIDSTGWCGWAVTVLGIFEILPGRQAEWAAGVVWGQTGQVPMAAKYFLQVSELLTVD